MNVYVTKYKKNINNQFSKNFYYWKKKEKITKNFYYWKILYNHLMRELIRKSYIEILKRCQYPNICKVLMGIRKCGKSYITNQFINNIDNKNCNIIYFDFNDIDVKLNYSTIELLHKQIIKKSNDKKQNILIIDEVQELKDWNILINSYTSKINFDVYITGSNANLLSKELSTLLTAKHTDIYIKPFNFKEYAEYMEYLKLDKEALFNEYFVYGGMPGRFLFDKNDHSAFYSYIKMIFSDIMTKDIFPRYKIENIVEFEAIFLYLMNNIGKIINCDNIRKYLISNNKSNISGSTIDNYLRNICDSFLLNKVPCYNLKTKNILNTNAKYYAIDTGFIKVNCIKYESNYGYILENIVFLHLLNNYSNILYIKEPHEIDFFCEKNNIRYLIQVCDEINSNNVKREIENLENIKINAIKIVICRKGPFYTTKSGIQIINIID
jgi:predicted AAA+ superfamily ATPase